MSPFADTSELTIDAEWDNMCDIVETSEDMPSSSKEVCKVLEEWTSDDESVDMDIMEVDEEIGSNFLCDDLSEKLFVHLRPHPKTNSWQWTTSPRCSWFLTATTNVSTLDAERPSSSPRVHETQPRDQNGPHHQVHSGQR
ncbi:hypothetical protein MHU86_4382 [Fragilaria crotonensis]|nr:hypothetical protein MHU86_4382 [Fragilaria crotonensis]